MPTSPLVSATRSEEHTSELQSRFDLVCRLLLEKKKPTFSRVLVGDLQLTLVALTAAVALLLLIACVNVRYLTLVRATARARAPSHHPAMRALRGVETRLAAVDASASFACSYKGRSP